MTPVSRMTAHDSGPQIAGTPEAPVFGIHLLQHALQVCHVVVPEAPDGRPREVAAILDGIAYTLNRQSIMDSLRPHACKVAAFRQPAPHHGICSEVCCNHELYQSRHKHIVLRVTVDPGSIV